MIVLDSVQILAAVRRSLANHVLPQLSDDFARVQVQSALKALEEVSDRLQNGDPADRSIGIIEAGVQDLAGSVRSESPAFARGLDAALAAAPEDGTSRDRARQLGEALWSLVSDSEDPAAARLLALLQEEALRTMHEDNACFRMENVAFGADFSFRRRPSDSAAHLSIGYLRETQVELIEPVRGESLYAEFLEAKGPGLHHLAFDVPDSSTAVAVLRESGLDLISQGRVGPGSEFAYFDCETAGTSVIEILGFDDGTRAFMDQLKQASFARPAETSAAVRSLSSRSDAE
jgi:hypothetical protein